MRTFPIPPLPLRWLGVPRVALCVVLLAACAAPEQAPPPEEEADLVPANEVTEPEAADGWRPLFDGESFDGWRGFRMEEVPAGWTVDDGTIHFVPPGEGEGPRADLITEQQFDDFELALEWKVTPGGNSGIFFGVDEENERTYFSGPEVQVLDDEGHRDGQSPLTSAGSNYALHAPGPYPKRPVGEWNEVHLIVRGPHVQHWMNGEKVVEYELWTPEWEQLVAASKFAEWPSYGRNPSGHIALQDHGDEVWFRNIRIRELGEE